MRLRMPLAMMSLLAFGLTGPAHAQITSNPIAEPIVKRGIAVEIKDLVRLPDTRGIRPAEQDVLPAGWARVSYVRDLPDGRRFANDSRGFLYLIDANNQPHVKAASSASFSIPNSRPTGCSIRCMPRLARAIRRCPISFPSGMA